jgi:hypothetical protein
VGRRWDEDRLAYTSHIDWMAQGGLRRTRQTARQAIKTVHSLEDAKDRLLAEEALDDPVRMIPYLLDGKAIEGRVTDVDLDHFETPKQRSVRRPLVTIRSDVERPIPAGKEFWWTQNPHDPSWIVHSFRPDGPGHSLITLKFNSPARNIALPAVGSLACFSIHNTNWQFPAKLSDTAPWPLRPTETPSAPAPIEDLTAEP